MGDKTYIEWCDATWNPLIGCSLVSAGCENCYAMKVAHRFQGTHKHYAGTTVLGKHGPRWTGLVNQAPLAILDQPLRWTRARFVFVNSMSDLFHETVPFEFIAAVFGVMAASPQHVFQVLTKRPERAVKFFEWVARFADDQREVAEAPSTKRVRVCLRAAFYLLGGEKGISVKSRKALDVVRNEDVANASVSWPLDNVWIGTSVEDQPSAELRIPKLAQIPAAVHWISAEPLLGPVDFMSFLWKQCEDCNGLAVVGPDGEACNCARYGRRAGYELTRTIDWMVVGGESGPGARPMAVSWAESILDQCKRAEVPTMFKQWGDWVPYSGEIKLVNDETATVDGESVTIALPSTVIGGEPVKPISIRAKKKGGKTRVFQAVGGGWLERVGKKVAGRELRGQHWDEYPKKRFAKSSAAA